MTMPTDELSEKILETLKKEFQKKYDNDTLLQELEKQIEKGNGNYEIAHAYSKRTGEILSEVFATQINGDVLPDGRMYFQMASDTIKPMLEQNHNIINEICQEVQANLNSKAGIKIKPATVPTDKNRINGIMTMIWQSEKFNDVKPKLSSATTNYTQSVVDKNIKANADLHYESGLTSKIERTSKGKCCKWCESLDGVYNYEDVKDKGNNVFRRHENCNCIVIYKPVSGKKQNVHTKQFLRDENIIEERKNYNVDIPHNKNDIANSEDSGIIKKKRTGADRANEFSKNWRRASLTEVVNKFVPNAEKSSVTDKGKIIFSAPNNPLRVVYDVNGDYFRIEDTRLKSSRKYLDLDGSLPNNKVINGKQVGRTKAEYQAYTHYKNLDLKE